MPARGLILLVAACTTAHHTPSTAEVASFPAAPNPDLDLLFLVDDSPDTADHQVALANALPSLFGVLDTLDVPPSYHIGVATSDLGTTGSRDPDHPAAPIGGGPGACAAHGKDGVLQVDGGVPVTDSFVIDIADSDGTRMRNYTGELASVLGTMLKVGSSGCGFEQHLGAIRRALTNPVNTGFIRPSANLGVVLIGDEDDCSVLDPSFFDPATDVLGPLQSFRCTRFGLVCDEDMNAVGPKTGCVPREDSPVIEGVQPFRDFFKTFKPDPRMVAVAMIVGDPSPIAVEARAPPGGGTPRPALAESCTFTDVNNLLEFADPALRDVALFDGLDGVATAFSTVCQQDLSPAATKAAHALKRAIGDPCVDLTTVADTDTDPGLQPICTASDDAGDLLRCPGARCFDFAVDAHACPDTPGNTRVVVTGATGYVHVRCQVPTIVPL
jgi:hypothetical protein